MKLDKKYFEEQFLNIHENVVAKAFIWNQNDVVAILRQIAADAAKVQRERCWVLCSLRDLDGSPRCKKCSATVKEVPGE